MYAVPDTELRNQVIRDVKNVLVPMYGRFLDKYVLQLPLYRINQMKFHSLHLLP